MNLPIPTPTNKNLATLTDDESCYILDDTLKEKRRNDPIILSFIDEFIRCKNIREASEACGIDKSLGYRIRHYVDVSDAISRLTDKSAIKYGFDASEIMERTKEIVDFDPVMVMNQDGTFKSNMHDIPAEARRCLKKLKVKNLWSETEDINGIKNKIIIGEVIEYEFYDKMKAIDLAGKEKDMFKNTTKVEHGVTKDMAAILLASSKRADEAKKLIKQADVIEVKGV